MASDRGPSHQVTPWRLTTIGLILALAAAGLVVRLAYLQLVDHRSYAAVANNEHDVEIALPAQRGTVLDANGTPLAISAPTDDIVLDKRLWSDAATAQTNATALAPLLNQEPQALTALAQSAAGGTVVAQRGVDSTTGQKIAALGLPGVIVQPSAERLHPEGDLASSLLGFVGRDGHGLAGLELALDPLLAGTPGSETFQRDAVGNPLGIGTSTTIAPTAGGEVQLTLDRTIQQMAEDELAANVKKTGASGGTVLVMDPNTGAILALASLPSYQFSSLDLNNLPQNGDFRDHALSDVYEPGSEFKLITMSAGIDTGKVNPNTTYPDLGMAKVGGATFHNWDMSTNGETTMTTVLVKSLNLGALWLATQVLGPETFYQYVQRFGFGPSTGSVLDAGINGIVRTPADPAWSEADLAANSFGQGISVSALQLCDAISAIVNGGKLMQPYIVQTVRSGSQETVTQPIVLSQVISPESAATLRGMMKEVDAAYPTAHIPGYSAGVKSGTAYVATGGTTKDAYATETTIPSFIGFAPFDHPRVLIYVKLDDLGTNDLGGTVAAPMFADMAKQVLAYLNVPPDVPGELPANGNETP